MTKEFNLSDKRYTIDLHQYVINEEDIKTAIRLLKEELIKGILKWEDSHKPQFISDEINKIFGPQLTDNHLKDKLVSIEKLDNLVKEFSKPQNDI